MPPSEHVASHQRIGIRPHPLMGLSILVAIAIATKLLHLTWDTFPLPVLTLGISMALGTQTRRFRWAAHWEPPYKIPLVAGMILLGAQFDESTLSALGPWAIPLLLLHWTLVSLLFAGLSGCGVVAPREAGILTLGMSGCGLTAVVSAAESDPQLPLRAQPLAIGVVMAGGALGFMTMPVIAQWLGLDARTMGAWAGLGLPTTTEAVLVGGLHSDAALKNVAAWRLLVNVLQGILVVTYLRCFGPTNAFRVSRLRGTLRSLGLLPAFTWGLVTVALLGALGFFQVEEQAQLARMTNWAFLIALTGIGLRTPPSLFRDLGWKLLLSALIVWGLAVAALLLILLVCL